MNRGDKEPWTEEWKMRVPGLPEAEQRWAGRSLTLSAVWVPLGKMREQH